MRLKWLRKYSAAEISRLNIKKIEGIGILKKHVSSIMAGIYIGLGATVYLVTENKIAGSFFFCVGICLVINYYNMLYTKIIPSYPFKNYSITDIVLAFFGNLIGGIFYAFLISQTRLADKISDRITTLMEMKINDSYISVFIMSVFCAVLVAYATFGDRIYPDNKIIATFFSMLFIMAFVMCGFDHLVANMFFYSFYAINNGFTLSLLPSFFIVLLGNTIGGLAIGYLEVYRAKTDTK